MRSIVTGVAGFIGSHLAERLLLLGHEVTGIDCFSGYYDIKAKEKNIENLLKKNKFNLIKENIFNADLDKLIGGADYVFHEAAQPGIAASWENTDEYIRNNIFSTLKMLDASKKANVRKFILASSSSVYGQLSIYPFRESFPVRPISPYAMTKLMAEELCNMYHQEDKLPTVVLRYFTVYGPRQRPDMAIYKLIKAALKGGEFVLFGGGIQERDFTYISDVVMATIRAGDSGKPGETYNIGSGASVSMLELIRIIETFTGKNINIKHQADPKGDMRKTLADIAKAQKELGYAPQINIKEGIAKQIEWMRNQELC